MTRSVEIEGLWGSTATASLSLLMSSSVVAGFCPICHLLHLCFLFDLWLAVFVILSTHFYHKHSSGSRLPSAKNCDCLPVRWWVSRTRGGLWHVLMASTAISVYWNCSRLAQRCAGLLQGFRAGSPLYLSVSHTSLHWRRQEAGDRAHPGDPFIAPLCTSHTSSAYSSLMIVSMYSDTQAQSTRLFIGPQVVKVNSTLSFLWGVLWVWVKVLTSPECPQSPKTILFNINYRSIVSNTYVFFSFQIFEWNIIMKCKRLKKIIRCLHDLA